MAEAVRRKRMQLAKLFSLPTIISALPKARSHPIPELKDSGFASQIQRVTASLFDDEATEQAISHAGRSVLMVSGFMMEAVVLDSVMDARARGYEVIVPVDDSGSPSARTEQAVIR
jgi:nicotinamidase-related amidase